MCVSLSTAQTSSVHKAPSIFGVSSRESHTGLWHWDLVPLCLKDRGQELFPGSDFGGCMMQHEYPNTRSRRPSLVKNGVYELHPQLGQGHTYSDLRSNCVYTYV